MPKAAVIIGFTSTPPWRLSSQVTSCNGNFDVPDVSDEPFVVRCNKLKGVASAFFLKYCFMSLKQLKQYEMVTSTMKTVTRSVSVAGFIHTFTIDEIRGRVQCASTVPVSSDASLTAWIGREFDILEAPVSAAIAIPASNNLAIVATENADLALVRQTGGSTLVKARSLHAHLSATAWIVSLALSQTLASTVIAALLSSLELHFFECCNLSSFETLSLRPIPTLTSAKRNASDAVPANSSELMRYKAFQAALRVATGDDDTYVASSLVTTKQAVIPSSSATKRVKTVPGVSYAPSGFLDSGVAMKPPTSGLSKPTSSVSSAPNTPSKDGEEEKEEGEMEEDGEIAE